MMITVLNNLLVQQACNYPESDYSRRRDGKAALMREKREKEEYSEGLHTLLCSGTPVKANQILSHDLLQTFPMYQKCKGFLSQLWRKELTLQNDANNAVVLPDN